MPIEGLTQEQRRLPRLGKIHLGIKKKNARGVEYPSAVDYFVCPPEVQAVFEEKPKELRILIPVEDAERWSSQYYRCYSKTRGLICKGDGVAAMRLIDTETGGIVDKDTKGKPEMFEIACRGRQCELYGHQCKEVMNLQFLLPEVPGLGVWQIDTGSINSIRNINSAADLITRIYGRISMIPLLLTLEPMEVRNPDDGKMKTVHCLNLTTNMTMVELARAANIKSLTVPHVTDDGLVLERIEVAGVVGDPPLPFCDSDMPEPDDERPELIMPEDQAPRGEEPTPEAAESESEPVIVEAEGTVTEDAEAAGSAATGPEKKSSAGVTIFFTAEGREVSRVDALRELAGYAGEHHKGPLLARWMASQGIAAKVLSGATDDELGKLYRVMGEEIEARKEQGE